MADFQPKRPQPDENLCNYCVHGYKGCWRKCSMKAIYEEGE